MTQRLSETFGGEWLSDRTGTTIPVLELFCIATRARCGGGAGAELGMNARI